MQSYMNDFNTFFSSIFNALKSAFNWLLSTTIGEIIVFTVLISIFIFIIRKIIDLKN